MSELTQSKLKQILDYDPVSGHFNWREYGPGRNMKKPAGHHERKHNVIIIGVEGRSYQAHRLVWLYVHGYIPEGIVDHLNHNNSDNRLHNLRERRLTKGQQLREERLRIKKLFRVCISESGECWSAYIQEFGITEHIGDFEYEVEAIEAYNKRSREIYGERGDQIRVSKDQIDFRQQLARGVTQFKLKQKVVYDRLNGILREKVNGYGTGRPLGKVDAKSGQSIIKIDGRDYGEHKLIWLYHYGYYPDKHVHHVNFDRLDNHLENLKEGNLSTRIKEKNDKIHAEGVYRVYRVYKDHEKRGWVAQIGFCGFAAFLGRFKSRKQAIKAYNDKSLELFPDGQGLIKMYRKKQAQSK